MRLLCLILPMTIMSFTLFSQKSFSGSLEYDIVSVDYLSKDTVQGKLFIYAIDSLIRINYLMQDGKKQESIYHINKHKYISLIELDQHFFAVQIHDTLEKNMDYRLLKNKNRKYIAGLKCKEAVLQYSDRNTLLYYSQTIPSQYFVGLNNAPGLPVKGQIPTDYGYMAFELQIINKQQPPISLFIPDKKYKILSLKSFLEWTQNNQVDLDPQ